MTDPGKVSSHAFFPFISYDKVSPRYRKAQRKVISKKRPIRYASHLDSAIYGHYASILSEAYENFLRRRDFGASVIAYRKLGMSNVHFADQVFSTIRSRVDTHGDCCAVCIDIEEFFDSLVHSRLKERWQTVLGVHRLPPDHYKVFRSVTRYAYVDRRDLMRALRLAHHTAHHRLCIAADFRAMRRACPGLVRTNKNEWGIPQGSPISAVLSNVYMIPFDEAVASFCRQRDCHYRRYSDDIIVLCSGALKDTVLDLLRNELDKQGLKMNTEKTEVCTFRIDEHGIVRCDRPLQYLGLTYDGRRALIRPSSLSRYHRKLRRYVRASEQKAHKSACDSKLYRRKALLQFTMRGKKSFIAYALRAEREMEMPTGIRHQIRRHWSIVNQLLQEADARLAEARRRTQR